jgi:hypothetical protein
MGLLTGAEFSATFYITIEISPAYGAYLHIIAQ